MTMTIFNTTIFCTIFLAHVFIADAQYLSHNQFMEWHSAKVCNGSFGYSAQDVCSAVSYGTTGACEEVSVYLVNSGGQSGGSSPFTMIVCRHAQGWIQTCVGATNTDKLFVVFNYDHDDNECGSYLTQRANF